MRPALADANGLGDVQVHGAAGGLFELKPGVSGRQVAGGLAAGGLSELDCADLFA